MEYEFIENVAEELGVKGDELQIIIKRLGIKTLQMGGLRPGLVLRPR